MQFRTIFMFKGSKHVSARYDLLIRASSPTGISRCGTIKYNGKQFILVTLGSDTQNMHAFQFNSSIQLIYLNAKMRHSSAPQTQQSIKVHRNVTSNKCNTAQTQYKSLTIQKYTCSTVTQYKSIQQCNRIQKYLAI